jgi:hypothetical protein
VSQGKNLAIDWVHLVECLFQSGEYLVARGRVAWAGQIAKQTRHKTSRIGSPGVNRHFTPRVSFLSQMLPVDVRHALANHQAEPPEERLIGLIEIVFDPFQGIDVRFLKNIRWRHSPGQAMIESELHHSTEFLAVFVEEFRKRCAISASQTRNQCSDFGIGFSGHRNLLVKSNEAHVEGVPRVVGKVVQNPTNTPNTPQMASTERRLDLPLHCKTPEAFPRRHIDERVRNWVGRQLRPDLEMCKNLYVFVFIKRCDVRPPSYIKLGGLTPH